MAARAGAPPLYLGSDAERFLGFLHQGAPAAGGAAVLLCPPFGWEEICSYRVRRQWAHELARAGHPTLRIDLPGGADSAGGPRLPARVQAWTQAILEAGEWLRAASGAERLAAIGIGLGGLLAAHAALERGAIDELVLWAVPARGRALVRELRAFARLELANAPGGEPDGERSTRADELIVNGYLLSDETVASLERLDLGEIEPASTASLATRRALLLGRDGLAADTRLASALELAGWAVTQADGPGYAEMMLEPQEARPPTQVFATVARWLGDGPDARAQGVSSPRAHVARPSPGPVELALDREGRDVRERPFCLEHPLGDLFGVLAEPSGVRAELCAVLFNAGAQRHTGPNRMWVEIARRWAARGVPSLRVDLAGIGDAGGDASALVQVSSFYRPEYVEQARAVLDALAERGLPARFLTLGLCAGAYWSLHAALDDERVGTIVMLNPRALSWDEWTYTVHRTRELRERVLLASTWGRALRGQLTFSRHIETARSIAGRALTAPRRAGERLRRGAGRGEEHAAYALFDALRERDQRALLVLSGKEPLRADFRDSGVLDRVDRWPNLELVLTGSAADTHTLTPLWLQREVHGLIDGALERELARTQMLRP